MFRPSVIEPLWEYLCCISADAKSDLASHWKWTFLSATSLPPSFSLRLLLSSLPRLLILPVLMFTFPILPHSRRWCTLLPSPYLHPPSQLLTPFLTPSHFLVFLLSCPSLFLSLSTSLSISLSCSLSSAVSVGVKRISRTKRRSKALNDGIEFWQNKFGLLTWREKLSLRQGCFKHI